MTSTAERVKLQPGVPLKRENKVKTIPVTEIAVTQHEPKPDWLKVRIPADSSGIENIKKMMREQKLHTVCQEASCPNLSECFSHGTATFMIMGVICTRRCPFCDVAHGKPLALDAQEPLHLAETVVNMNLKYVVLTSVDRDDLRDGGAEHFSECVSEIRKLNPSVQIETLVPDFRGRLDMALSKLKSNLPDVFNHNLETTERLYRVARPGANYKWSLELLKRFKEENPDVPTKSGLMVGLGETNEEIITVLEDLRAHGVTMLTLGQYLSPSSAHLPVQRYVTPEEFNWFKEQALAMGFTNAACGPFVRSSYHADRQAQGIEVS